MSIVLMHFCSDFWFIERDAKIHEENTRLVRRMEMIHFRPWEKGIMGRDLNVPFPAGKTQAEIIEYKSNKLGSLNFVKRKEENLRIKKENVRLFKKLVTAQGGVSSLRESIGRQLMSKNQNLTKFSSSRVNELGEQ